VKGRSIGTGEESVRNGAAEVLMQPG